MVSIMGKKQNSIRRRTHGYVLNLLISIDQFFSALSGYNADTVVSAAIGEIMWLRYRGASIPYGRMPVKALLQRALDKIEKQHCLKSYRNELVGRRMVVPFPLTKLLEGS